MLHHAEARHLEGTFDLAEALAIELEKAVEDLSPSWVGESLESRLVSGLRNM
jgi:hypothetical protein